MHKTHFRFLPTIRHRDQSGHCLDDRGTNSQFERLESSWFFFLPLFWFQDDHILIKLYNNFGFFVTLSGILKVTFFLKKRLCNYLSKMRYSRVSSVQNAMIYFSNSNSLVIFGIFIDLPLGYEDTVLIIPRCASGL